MKEKLMESKRIIFSKWEDGDIELARKLFKNEEVSRYITAKGYFTEEEIQSRLNLEISNYEKYKIQYWPLYYKDNDEFFGSCGLRPYDLKNDIVEIGIYLLPEYWGMGLASEALQRVIKYSFEDLKVNNLFAGHNPKNEASKKMLLKNGFNFIREEFYEPTGLMHPSYLYKV